MSKDIDQVRVGVDGVVATAEKGAPAPTSAMSALPEEYDDLGYISEDGVTESANQTTEKLRAWQNAKVVRNLVTEGETSFQFVLLQTSAETVAYYYGGEVEADGSIVINPLAERPVKVFDLDVIDGDEVIRAWAPEAQVTEVGDIVYQNGAPIGYEVTVTCSVVDDVAGTGKKGSVIKWFKSLDTASGS